MNKLKQTNVDMATSFIKAFNHGKILIPLLQRDYVQGGVESIISPFVQELFSGEPVDLNYIYGYEEEGGFVPIDGQQRLITLWLLHMFVANKEGRAENFDVQLTFMGREYANDFCTALKANLKHIISAQYSKLSDEIVDQNWFIASWRSSRTVECMLKALDCMNRLYGANSDKCTWNKLNSEDCHITFSFLKMDQDQGLDDDIYIKMNGRGRALSGFENLKSWMDEKVASLFTGENYAEFVSAWRLKMDNEWTDFFWKNRNRQQEHPEEIDDEQLFCFCNLLILYWLLDENRYALLLKNIEDLDAQLKEELQMFLTHTESANVKPSDEIRNDLFDYLQSGVMLPLTWLDRLTLIDKGFFAFANDALDTLSKLSGEFNALVNTKNKHYLYLGNMDGNTLMYNLVMTKGSYAKTFPLLYSLISICAVDKSNEEQRFQRIRVMRNLIENSTIDSREKLQENIIPSIKKLEESLNGNSNILSLLAEDEPALNGFDKSQVEEEIRKAEYAKSDLMKDVVEMENSSFFRGRIGCMFSFLGSEGYEALTDENFRRYKSILMSIFPSNEGGGVASSLDDKEYLLRRALLCMSDHDYGYNRNRGRWSFCNGVEDWRIVLAGVGKDAKREAIRQLVMNINREIKEISERDIHDFLKAYVNSEAEKCRKSIDEDKGVQWWMYFVYSPDVWHYMDAVKLVKWENENDVFLKYSVGNNSNKMELRTYSLYLDRNKICSDEAVGLDIYQRENTCLYFEISWPCAPKHDAYTIAIDVFHGRTCENDYCYCLFTRQSDGAFPDDEKLNSIIKSFNLTHEYKGENKEFCNPSRYFPAKIFSRSEIIAELSELLKCIVAAVQK